MYIKLGTLNLVYHQDVDDWMIMAEILESGMSYERPILVRTTNELDMWFGKEFPGYEFMTELLNQNITLYLYKPVSNSTTGSDGYIDFSEYSVLENVWLREIELEWVYNVLIDPERYKFKMYDGEYGFNIIRNTYLELTNQGISEREYCTDEIVRDELPSQIEEIYITHEHALFHVYDSENLWLVYDEAESIVDSSLLPQNIDFMSSSLDNRDTIIIGSGVDSENPHVPYTHLDYRTGEPNLGIYKDELDIIQYFSGVEYFDEIDMDFVNHGFQSFVLRVSGEFGNEEPEYLILPDASHGNDSSKWVILYNKTIPESVDSKYYRGGRRKITDWSSEFRYTVEELGYEVYETNNETGDLLLVSHTILPVLYFQKSKTLNVTPEIKTTQKILSKFIENPCFEMWSKTIGRGSKFDDSDLITVDIEKPDDFGKNYRVTISRYSYSETFEGPVYITDPGKEERLDHIITNNSKLIYCNYLGGTVRTGTFRLRGGEIESTNPEMYEYSLDQMFSESTDPVFPDYFFVPDIYRYVDKEKLDMGENKYFPIYKKFLEYAKQLDFQFLIENTDPYKIETVNKLPEPEERTSEYYKISAKYYTVSDKEEVLNEKTLSLINEYSSVTVFKDPQTENWTDDNTYYIYEKYYNSDKTTITDQEVIDSNWNNVEIVKELPVEPESGKIYLIRKYFRGRILISRKYIIDNIEDNKALTIEDIENPPTVTRDYKYLKLEEVYYDRDGNKIEDMLFLKTCDGDYTMNYIEDTENRLIYFYRNFSFFEHKRPAYYIYLNGLLNDIYSVSTKDILYTQPTGNPFEDEKVERNLEKYKSNYLVCDNQTYYYKKYQDGETWITTGWMRFAAGKISRELQKNKWNYLGLPLMGKTRTVIEEILYRISNNFSIVGSIIMTKFEPVPTSNLLNLEINTYTNDLVKNNLKLDVTLDYNNINKLN